MTNPRLYDDGTLAYPKKGMPPPLREGYIRDPREPYNLIPEYPPCTKRELIVNDKVPCNRSPTGFRTESFQVCHLGLKVSHQNCTACKQRTPPT